MWGFDVTLGLVLPGNPGVVPERESRIGPPPPASDAVSCRSGSSPIRRWHELGVARAPAAAPFVGGTNRPGPGRGAATPALSPAPPLTPALSPDPAPGAGAGEVPGNSHVSAGKAAAAILRM